MNSITLLLWIALGIVAQSVVFLAVMFWRHWQDYVVLRQQTVESGPLSAGKVVAEVASEEKSTPGWVGYREFKVTRKLVEDGTQTVCSFYLAPTDQQPLPPFLPGQFLTFRIDAAGASGITEQIIRCYSLSDRPREDGYRVSIKRIPAPVGSELPSGRSSSHFHDRVAVGSTLQVRAPAGHFYLDDSTTPVVLIGGGIGITPMLSMLLWCLAEQPGREVWLYYGVRNGRELVMRDQLLALAGTHPNFHLRLCFSNPLPEERAEKDYQHIGRVDVALFRTELTLKPYHFYICGPAPMMASLVHGLEDWGVPDARIHFEAFGPASIPRKSAAVSPKSDTTSQAASSDIVVSFARSDKQLRWTPAAGTLLDFAEANGIAIDSGCRAGSCGTCQTTILSGQVSYRHPPDFDPDPGTCLMCVCIPQTSLSLEV